MCKKIQSNEGRKAVANMATFMICPTKQLWTHCDADAPDSKGSKTKLLGRTTPHPTLTGKAGLLSQIKFSLREPQQCKGATLKYLYIPL